ncbi:MAG: hypothetical protein WA431_13670 [Candidatus Cybelea sp.]
MRAAWLVGAIVFVAILLAALWRSVGPQTSVALAIIGGLVSGIAQAMIGHEQLSIMRRAEQRDIERSRLEQERAERETPDLKASVEFRAKSELEPRGIHADERYNALIRLENHGRGTAEKVTITASRQQGEPLVREVGIVTGGDTKFIALPLQLGPSIEATAATAGRSIVIDYEGARSPIVFEMTQTHPPGW